LQIAPFRRILAPYNQLEFCAGNEQREKFGRTGCMDRPDCNEGPDQTETTMDTRVTIAPQIRFIDDAAQGIFRYSPKVFPDPELFECEQRRIFDQSCLCEDTRARCRRPEIPDRRGRRKAAHHRARDDGRIAFFTQLPHRGATVVPPPPGNARPSCASITPGPTTTSRLDGVPLKMLRAGFQDGEMGLYAARTQNYRAGCSSASAAIPCAMKILSPAHAPIST